MTVDNIAFFGPRGHTTYNNPIGDRFVASLRLFTARRIGLILGLWTGHGTNRQHPSVGLWLQPTPKEHPGRDAGALTADTDGQPHTRPDIARHPPGIPQDHPGSSAVFAPGWRERGEQKPKQT